MFAGSLSLESKSPQISGTLLSILADLSNAVVWMVSIFLLIFNSFSPFFKPSGTAPSEPTTIGITSIHMFRGLFSSLARYEYLSIISLPFILTQCLLERQNPQNGKFFFFLVCETRSRLLAETTWSVFILNHRELLLLLLLLLLLTPWEIFTSVLADGLSLEFESQQVSSSLQDSSQYSGHSQ